MKTSNKNILHYKNSLIQQLKLSIQDGEYDKDEYNMYNDKFHQLKKTNENIEKKNYDSEVKINWPVLMEDMNISKSKTTKFIELLIWYSKIKNIIDNIKINNKNKEAKFQFILKLQEFEEMKYASNLIISTEELTEEEFKMIYSTLNSHYIFKMLKSKLEEYLYNPVYEINIILENNLLLKNNTIINKNDFYYIHEYVKELGNEFLLQIPKFTSKDIVFLFIQFGAKNKNKDYEPSEGPVIKQIKYSRLLDVLMAKKNKILDDDFGKKSAETSAKEIIFTLSIESFGIKDSFDDFTNDIENKILNLKDNKNTQKEKEFVNLFKMILNIAKNIDRMNSNEINIKLSFDDILFLKEQKWYQDIKYTTTYPHLIYILNKYEKIYENINEIYKKDGGINEDNNTIPFWLILLRLLANIDNIEVEYNQDSDLSRRISNDESNYLRNKLVKIAEENNDENKNNKISINTQWLNLCIKDLVNSSIYSKKSRLIYNFVVSQIEKFPNLEKEISKVIEENLIKFNNSIFDDEFENKIEDIYNIIITEDNESIKIVKDPRDFYLTKINNKYNEIMNNLINHTVYKKLDDFFKAELIANTQGNSLNENNDNILSNENKPFNYFYESLKKEITDTLKTIDEQYKQSLEESNRKAYDEKLNNIILFVNAYNNEIEKLEKIFNKNNKNLNNKSDDQIQNISNNDKKGNDNDIENLIEKEEKLENSIEQNIKNESINSNQFNEDNLNLNNIQKIIIEFNKQFKKSIHREYDKYIEKDKNTTFNYILISIKFEEEQKQYIRNPKNIQKDIKIKFNTEYIKDEDKIQNLDINNLNPYLYYLPFKEGEINNISNLVTIMQGDEELKKYSNSKSPLNCAFHYQNDKKKIYSKNIVIKIDTYKINKYDINSIKKKKIQDEITKFSSKTSSKKTLNFGQYSYYKEHYLYNLLEDFNTNIKEFAININNISIDNKINCIDIVNKINNLSEKTKQISKLLKVNCSDGTQFPKITDKLDNIQKYFDQLNSLFKIFVDYLNKKISKFITSYDKDNSNLKTMLTNKKMKIPISNFKPNISFDSINPDSSQLFTLIISEDKGKVTSSQSDITLDFGAYIPSIIKGDFSIYVLSIVNEKLYPSISFEIDDKTGLPDTKFANSIIVNNNNN